MVAIFEWCLVLHFLIALLHVLFNSGGSALLHQVPVRVSGVVPLIVGAQDLYLSSPSARFEQGSLSKRFAGEYTHTHHIRLLYMLYHYVYIYKYIVTGTG